MVRVTMAVSVMIAGMAVVVACGPASALLVNGTYG